MKLLMFLMKPLKFIVLMLFFLALIYYRPVIFHSNVNQYINSAQSYLEDIFDISIPVHMVAADQVEAVVQHECELPVANAVNEVPAASTGNEHKQAASAEAVDNADDSVAIIEVLAETLDVINEKVDMLFAERKQAIAMASTSTVNESSVAPAAGDRVNDYLADRNQENTGISPAGSASFDTKQVLQMARQLFWSGDVQSSERLYLDLVNMDDSDADAYGELGNVYYAQGKWKQAGEAYYEAAVRLLALEQDGQKSNRISYLLRVIQGLDAESAEKLRNKISG